MTTRTTLSGLRLQASHGAKAFTENSSKPIVWFSIFGAVCITLQIYVYSAWIMSPGFAPTLPGTDPIPLWIKIMVRSLEAAGVLGMIAAIVYTRGRSRREGRMCFDEVLLWGFVSIYWLDPGGNYIRTQNMYNSYFFNYGSWGPFIPGWISPNGHLLPEPLLWTGFMYTTSALLFVIGICWVLRKAKSLWPSMSKAQLVLVALVSGFLIDLILEVGLVRTEMYQYPGAIQALSIWGGERYQFPVYEALFWGAGFWGVVAAIRHFQDDKGRSVVERGVDEMRISETSRNGLRILAMAGIGNLLFILYNLLFAWFSLYGGPTPEDIPSYMRNGMCGMGTQYECPTPFKPVPLPHSGPQPPEVK